MDRNTILAVTLCFLIFMGWQKLYVEPHMHPGGEITTIVNSPATSNNVANTQTNLSSGDSQVASSSQGQIHTPVLSAPHPEKTLPLVTNMGTALLGDGNFFFSGWSLKNYKLALAPGAPAVDLHSVTQEGGALSFAFDDPNFGYLNNVQGKLTSTPQGAVWSYEDANVKLSREFDITGQKPYLDMTVKAEFKAKRPKFAFVSLASQSPEKDPEAQDRQLVYWTNQNIERLMLKDSQPLKEIPTPVKYIGATNRYFILTVVAQGQTQPSGLVQPLGATKAGISLVYPVSENSITIPVRVYFGPKELEFLRQVEPTLDHTVDFGWFTIFAYPLLKLLKWLYQFAQNYGLAIIVLTILLKILTYPLTYKSMKSMKKMAKLQPQLARIREKYKDDKEALNREMLTMMKSNGYNPMAGCLPMLIQMPIFFALYRVLYSSIELYHAPFIFWIRDLSSHDPFYVTPVLLSLTMFVQQKLTPNTATDPAQARMMQMMPLIFGAFMLALPAGLTVYMLVNAIASIIQQVILNKKFDTAPAT
ncbi:MAG: membrane protein insertase YidC [Bdellovibrionia bacterium]